MDALQDLLSGENGSAIQLVLITLLLMIALIVIVWIFRRIAGSPSRRAARNRIPRLSITDSTAVDDKRYLVLLRRDSVEHLVLIGGPTDVVVESGIVRVQPVAKSDVPVRKGSSSGETDPKSPPPSNEIVAPAAATAATVAAVALTADTDKTSEAVAKSDIAPENSANAPVIAENNSDEIAEKLSTETEEVTAEIDIVEPEAVDLSGVEDAAPSELVSENTPEVEAADNEPSAPSSSAESMDADIQAHEGTAGDEPVTKQVDEANLEEEISAQLDDALSSGDFSVEPVSEPEDDMQRLLDELAGNSKEPA